MHHLADIFAAFDIDDNQIFRLDRKVVCVVVIAQPSSAELDFYVFLSLVLCGFGYMVQGVTSVWLWIS